MNVQDWNLIWFWKVCSLHHYTGFIQLHNNRQLLLQTVWSHRRKKTTLTMIESSTQKKMSWYCSCRLTGTHQRRDHRSLRAILAMSARNYTEDGSECCLNPAFHILFAWQLFSIQPEPDTLIYNQNADEWIPGLPWAGKVNTETSWGETQRDLFSANCCCSRSAAPRWLQQQNLWQLASLQN